MSAADYIALVAARADIIRRFDASTRDYDALALPTCPLIPPRIADLAQESEYTRVNMLMLRNNAMGNFLDRCAISLPCHAVGELPVGFMLMGEAMADRRILAMARSVAPVVKGQ